MKYTKNLPEGVKVMVKHRSRKEKIEGMLSAAIKGKKYFFHSDVLHGGNPEKYGYNKSWVFSIRESGGFTEGIESIELLIPEYEIF
jgi:hypothetical protein